MLMKKDVIGSPMGLDNTISEGIISGLRETSKSNLIQITATYHMDLQVVDYLIDLEI